MGGEFTIVLRYRFKCEFLVIHSGWARKTAVFVPVGRGKHGVSFRIGAVNPWREKHQPARLFGNAGMGAEVVGRVRVARLACPNPDWGMRGRFGWVLSSPTPPLTARTAGYRVVCPLVRTDHRSSARMHRAAIRRLVCNRLQWGDETKRSFLNHESGAHMMALSTGAAPPVRYRPVRAGSDSVSPKRQMLDDIRGASRSQRFRAPFLYRTRNNNEEAVHQSLFRLVGIT